MNTTCKYLLIGMAFIPLLARGEITPTPTTAIFESSEKARETVEAKIILRDKFGIVTPNAIADLYDKISNRIKVPGYISLRAQQPFGRIIGPNTAQGISFAEGDEVFIRWGGATRPDVGELYSSMSPAVLMQNRIDFTDFRILLNDFNAREYNDNYNLAGYVYESNGEIEIIDVSRGVIKGRVINSAGPITLDDKIFATLPAYASIKPISTPARLAAAVVSGSPPTSLTASLGSIIYLNRGKRDGIKVGTIFNTLEPIYLTDAPPIKRSGDVGQVMVIFASDGYSTAVVTKQFRMISIGSLMESQVGGPSRASEYELLTANRRRSRTQPTPRQVEAGGNADQYTTELDQIERDSDILSLSPEERARLEKLHQQELRKRGGNFPLGGESQALPDPSLDDGGSTPLPPAPNLFKAEKRRREARQRRLLKRKEKASSRDEEDLNSLFDN